MTETATDRYAGITQDQVDARLAEGRRRRDLAAALYDRLDVLADDAYRDRFAAETDYRRYVGFIRSARPDLTVPDLEDL